MLHFVSIPQGFRRILLTSIAALLVGAPVAAQNFSQPDSEPAPQVALIQKANDALAAGDYRSALTLLTTLDKQTPNNAQILYDLGLTLEALQSEPASSSSAQTSLTPEACYRKAIDANAAFPPPHVALGLLLARTNHPEEARQQFKSALALPDLDSAVKARALRALARLDVSANPSAASAELLDALKLSREQPADVLLSAHIAEASSDLPGAEQAYRRYLALPEGRTDSQATAALAHVLIQQHRAADAETLLSQALTQHPGDPSFTAQLAEAYVSSGDAAKSAQAAPLLEKLHASHPEDRNISRLLARVYMETGKPEEADKLYASLTGPTADPTLLADRAEALMRLRRPAEAEKLLKQALANPHAFPTPAALGDAALDLAFAASAIDDPRTTLQALAIRAKVQPSSPPSLFLEATANDALHQSSKAAELYKQFLAAAAGHFPEQELQARQRIAELGRK